jgi:hypothetical protein
LSEYRIHESIVDDNSLPSGVPSSTLQDDDSVSSPSSGNPKSQKNPANAKNREIAKRVIG